MYWEDYSAETHRIEETFSRNYGKIYGYKIKIDFYETVAITPIIGIYIINKYVALVKKPANKYIFMLINNQEK